MRRWLLLVIVLLLPLRGWLGDAMAGQMHHGHGSVTHAAAVHHDVVAQHDCGEHALSAPAQADAAEVQPAAGADACASCQACSSVGLSPAVTAPPPAHFTHPQPQALEPAYASADAGLFYKPPRH